MKKGRILFPVVHVSRKLMDIRRKKGETECRDDRGFSEDEIGAIFRVRRAAWRQENYEQLRVFWVSFVYCKYT